MAQIARLDLSKYFSNEINAKYGDAISITSARLSPLHVLAIYGGSNIDSLSYIMESSMTIWDADKNFPLHLAAASGRLFAFPVEKVAVDQLHYINSDGCSVFDLAHFYKNDIQLPPGLRSDSFRQMRIPKPKSAPVIEAARVGELENKIRQRIMAGLRGEMPISNPDLLADIFLKAIRYDLDGSNLLHLAAENDSFGEIPIEVLTEESLLLRDKRGRTPLHRISSLAGLEGLPPEIVTRKVLTARDHQGISVADVLVNQDTENIVPDNIRLLAKGPVIARIKELIAESPNAAEDFWNLHGREHLSEQNLHDLVRDQRLRGIIDAIHSGHPIDFKDLEPGDLLCKPPGYPDNPTLVHLIARSGLLHSLPDEVFSASILSCHDDSGRTPFHYAVEAGTLGLMPAGLLTKGALLAPDKSGITSFHIASGMDCFGSVPVSLFDRDVLLYRGRDERTVADMIEHYGNTPLLPFNLRFCSRIAAARELERLLAADYLQSEQFWSEHLTAVIGEEEFRAMRGKFVRDWSARFPNMELDEEQAEAVAEYGPHIQVTARAGSGKTRTLVARALFQITHCRIPASSILILAFNKKAVEEIRERLSKYLSEERMPHVLTFHALAYRIVRPSEDLIFDEGETKESQVFSTIIQRIIDEGMRSGSLESELRVLMMERWECDLKRIVGMGFDLSQEEFLEFRAMMPSKTMDGRRVPAEAHKHVGNALLRLRVRYSHRRRLHRYAGEAYAPDFSYYNKDTDQRLVFELLGEVTNASNPARQAYWKSDRAAAAHLVQLREEDCVDAETTLHLVAKELAARGVAVSPMNDDELWLVLRDDVIRDFTKAVRGFISRCQKELVSPDQLDQMVSDARLGLDVQVRFWRLAGRIYHCYRQVLAEEHQTDFDQLMLDAAGLIHDGRTGFTSTRGSGDIHQIRHLLIDEFQDFSHLFNELRKSILTQIPDANFFCVGDDWQAINKFAGSDLRYFTEFGETFEPAVRKLISRNYRSSRKIVEIGNQVMAGEGEPSIPNSGEQGNTWRVEANGLLDCTEAEEIVVEELGDEAATILRIVSDCASRGEKVAVLSRTRSVATPEGMLKLERWQARLRSFLPENERGLLETSTTHGYKGKEAAVVILLDPEGYPSIHPDSIFSFIFGDSFRSIEADEKRLFYVGVTRAKKTLFLLSCPLRYTEKRSYWIKFLKTGYPPAFDLGHLQPRLLCGGRVVVRLANLPHTFGSGGTFAFKDRLKSAGYKWNEENKTWSIYLEAGSINSPFECRQFLLRQPWIGDADGVLASFAWEDQQHRMKIVGGKVMLDATAAQMEEHLLSEKARPDSLPRMNLENVTPPVHRPTEAKPASSVEAHHTRVAGVTYDNRAPAIRRLRVGEAITLMRRPHNPKDPNAIEVLSADSSSLGYIPATLAARIARRIDQLGGLLQATVTEMLPGEANGAYLSLNVQFDLPGAPVASPIQTSVAPSNPLSAAPQPSIQPSPSSLSLTPNQDKELVLLNDARLRPIITELYLSGSCPWPVIGYHGQGPTKQSADSMLEVAWPDQKIGIYLPANNVTTFAANGWVILPAAAVTVDMLRSVLSSALPIASEPPRVEPQVDPPIVSTTQTVPCDCIDPAILEALTQKQREELENLLEPRLAPIIAEMYLSGRSDWPTICYEGVGSDGRCTGSMLEVAWLDFKIGIAIPENDFRSFAEAGWMIAQASTVTASELRDQFAARTGPTTPSATIRSTQPNVSGSGIGERSSSSEFTDVNIHIQHGQFYDEEPDDDLPF